MGQLEFNIGGIILYIVYSCLPWVLGILHIRRKKNVEGFHKYECLLHYFLFIGVGLQGLITGVMQIFYPDYIAAYAKWPVSPFLAEVGMANVAFGILGILSLFYKKGWQTATGLGYALFLGMAAIGHIKSAWMDHNFSLGNVGPTLWSDIIISLSILFLLFAHRREKTAHD